VQGDFELRETDFEIRFCVLHRLLHLMSMAGFLGLAITGLFLGLGDWRFFSAVVSFFGGAAVISTVHKICAVFTYSCVVIHLFWLLYYKTILKGKLFGKNSAMLNLYDLKSFIDHIKHNLGAGEYPKFYRFTYWEKFDYLAMLLGMNTMALTGVLIWFPDFWSHYIPGMFLNIGRILHFYEALMAIFLKIVIHVSTTHLRPGVFPMDKSIFSGRISIERLTEEHPLELETVENV
jgi:cytochrome b subunit of formate dehydrogenase